MAENSRALYRAGEGEPLLLLHGVTGTWHHWRPVLGDLVAKFEVIAPTLAGHDGGPPFTKTGALDLGDATDSLEEHLEELGLDTFHVAGNSLGGSLALELAKRGRARSVVALSPGGGWRPGDPGGNESRRVARFFARTQLITKASDRYLPQLLRWPVVRRVSFRDVMYRGEQVPLADAVHMARTAIHCTIIEQVIDSLKAGASIEGLDQVKAPTLVAWAKHDRVLRMNRQSERFRTQIPDVEFRVLEGVGHVPMYDDPPLIADTIIGFVEKHLSEAPAPAAVA